MILLIVSIIIFVNSPLVFATSCTTDSDCPTDGWYCTDSTTRRYYDYWCLSGSCTQTPLNQQLCINGCLNGECITGCATECSPEGDTECTSSSRYKTCGDYDSDDCLEWSTSTTSCPADGWYCESPNTRHYRDYGCLGGGCSYSPSSQQLCSNGCINGQCITGCTNECNNQGDKQCVSGSSYEICGDYDGDPCLEWSTSTSNCPSDGWECIDSTTRRYCDYSCSGGSCSCSPSQQQLCTGGTTCSNGQCVSSDPCGGVDCNDYCSGDVRYYSGSCSDSNCYYSIYDCNSQNYYEDYEYYCNGNEVWKHRKYHDYSCYSGSCTYNTWSWYNEQFVESCTSCIGGACDTCGNGVCDPGETTITCLDDCAECLIDSGCPADGWYDNPICTLGDVVRLWRDHYCSDYVCQFSGEYQLIQDCTSDEICSDGQCIDATQTCSDSTPYGQCSLTKPKYCDNGNLIDNCQECGCDDDTYCYGGPENSYYYKSGSCLTNKELLKIYSPALYTDSAERFYPRSINSMLENSNLKAGNINTIPYLIKQKPVTELDLEQDPIDLWNIYLDLDDSSCLAQEFDSYCLYNSISVPSQMGKYLDYPSRVYGRVFEDKEKYPNKIVLQYWYFYVFDAKEMLLGTFELKSLYSILSKGLSPIYSTPLKFIIGELTNSHEGDWEMTQIILEKDTDSNVYKPISSTYSFHGIKKTYSWEEVHKYFDQHPKVYVALFSHASYRDPEDIPRIVSTIIGEQVQDKPYPTMVERTISVSSDNFNSYYINVIDENTPWVDFIGTWGQMSWSKSKSGPLSPGSAERPEWSDPIEWAGTKSLVDTLVFDFLEEILKVVAGSPVELHAYDSEGNHVGLNSTGGYDVQIPGFLFGFFQNDSSQPNIMVFTNVTNITFIAEAYDSGNMSFVMEKTDRNITTKLSYGNISIENSTNIIVRINEDGNYTMDIDLNGDNQTDYQVEPNISIYEDLDKDGVLSFQDNCLNDYNPTQIDADNDGTGDSCDAIIMEGDANNDYQVNLSDLINVSLSSGLNIHDENYDPNADLNHDGVINVFDLATVGFNYGKSLDICTNESLCPSQEVYCDLKTLDKGVCKPLPEECQCIASYNPVCGNDRKTYSNDCTLSCLNIIKECDGECPCEPECTLDEDCGNTTYWPWSDNYCYEGKLVHNRTVNNAGCVEGSCTFFESVETEMVELCNNGCENNECIGEFCINETFDTTSYMDASTTADWDTSEGKMKIAYADSPIGTIEGSHIIGTRSSGSYHMGEAFMLPDDFVLESVSFKINSISSSIPSGLWVQIRTDNGGNPSNTVLREVLNHYTTIGWKTVSFSPLQLNKNTRYYIVLLTNNQRSGITEPEGNTYSWSDNHNSQFDLGYQQVYYYSDSNWHDRAVEQQFVFYLNGNYKGEGASIDINSGGTITSATLNVLEQKPGSSSISYYLSANGGTNWEGVSPEAEHIFTNQGTDLRWKAVLETSEISEKPEVESLEICYS